MSIKCGAKTKSGTKCKHPAGHRTSHVGTGRCWLHGGASNGAPKGNKNALKHGLYARIYSDAEMEAAKEMLGTIENEIAISRLQLASLLMQQREQQDSPAIQEIHEKTIVQTGADDQRARFIDDLKASADRCGEEYDPDGDEEYIEAKESEIFERKRAYQRRDFSTEIARLIALIGRLESQRLGLQLNQLQIEQLKAGDKNKNGDESRMSGEELDSEISELLGTIFI